LLSLGGIGMDMCMVVVGLRRWIASFVGVVEDRRGVRRFRLGRLLRVHKQVEVPSLLVLSLFAVVVDRVVVGTGVLGCTVGWMW